MVISFLGVFFDPVIYTPMEEQITEILIIRSERPVSSDSILRVYDRDGSTAARMPVE